MLKYWPWNIVSIFSYIYCFTYNCSMSIICNFNYWSSPLWAILTTYTDYPIIHLPIAIFFFHTMQMPIFLIHALKSITLSWKPMPCYQNIYTETRYSYNSLLEKLNEFLCKRGSTQRTNLLLIVNYTQKCRWF